MKELIHHTGRFSIVYSDYLEITGDACAAQILDAMERWTTHKLSESGETWIYARTYDFVSALCGTFKRSKVIEALKLLKEKGFIETKSSPEPRDQTLLYKLNIEKVQTALDKIHNDREGAA